MKTIYDNNFLNGQLYLSVDEDRKVVLGEFRFYDEIFDDFFTLKARSKCRKGDNWSENKGMELVKSKLTREYHKIFMNQLAEEKRTLEAILRYVTEEYEFRKRKVTNIEKDLSEHFGLTYWRKEPAKKPAAKTKKPAAKKTTTKKK